MVGCGLHPSGLGFLSAPEGRPPGSRQGSVLVTQGAERVPSGASHRPSLRTSCDELVEVTQSLAGPCTSCPDPGSIRTARDGKGAPLMQVCSPVSSKAACTCAGGTKGPFSVTSRGAGRWPPVTEEPRCPPCGPRTAAALPQALFSLHVWVSGVFLHGFPNSVG